MWNIIFQYGIPVKGVKFEETEIKLGVGEDYQLLVVITPNNASHKKITWSISNPNVITVNKNALVHALWPGEVTIRVTTEDGDYTAKCKVIVFYLLPQLCKKTHIFIKK